MAEADWAGSIPRLQLFISSPGDVATERERAAVVVKRLNEEFRHYTRLAPYFWEHEPALAMASFQDQIPRPSQSDIVIVILWARIGMRLPAGNKSPDGSPYASGTHYELDDALRTHAAFGTPDLLVYRKDSEPPMPIDATKLQERVEQLQALNALIARTFFNDDGSFKRAFRTFTTADEFERQLEAHLRVLIRRKIEKFEQRIGASQGEILIHRSPYRGLEVFDIADALVFHGRDRAIHSVRKALIARAVQGCAFLLILGMSGSGKSSLVRAGLLHALIEKPEFIPGVDLWRWCLIRPGDATGDLVASLAHAFLGNTGLPELLNSGLESERLARTLRTNPREIDLVLLPALRAAGEAERLRRRSDQPHEVRLIAVIDQMEEIFTGEAVTDQDRVEFVAVLSALARSGLVWVVATMRSEFYARCAELPELVALKEGQGQYDLLEPTFAEVGQMIRFPARDAGLRWGRDPTNTDRRLDDVLQEAAWSDPKGLPLLQFTLHELFLRRAYGRTLAFEEYEALGGLGGALARRADAELAQLDPAAQEALPVLLRSLVTVSLGDQEPIVARRVPLTPLEADPLRGGLLHVLIKARLLTTDRDDKGQAVVGVAHEALLTHWPRLKTLLDADREFLRARANVAVDHQRWQREGKSVDLLLPDGKPLEVARDLVASRPDELDDDLRKYIGLSDRYRTRLRNRLRNAALLTLAVVSMLTLFSLGEWRNAEVQKQLAIEQKKQAVDQKKRADEQRYEAERFASRLALDRGMSLCSQGDSPRGLLWMARALRIAPESAGDLRAYIRLDLDAWGRPFHRLLRSMEHRTPQASETLPPLGAVAFSPDGTRLATASGRTAQLWNTATGQLIGKPMSHLGQVRAVAFSPDRVHLATASDDATAKFWEAATAATIGDPLSHHGAVRALAFSPDGKVLATACDDGNAQLWNTTTRVHSGIPMEHSSIVWALAFSPDGTRLATAGGTDAQIWDVATSRALGNRLSHKGVVGAVAFSPDGTRLATASDDMTAKLWNATNGQLIGAPLGHGDGVVAVAFSPDSKRLATAARNPRARIWDAATARPIDPPLIHQGWVNAIAFSPDGTRLVTTGEDATARLWDAITLDPIGPPLQHPASTGVTAVAFSPDGNLIATGGNDETVRLWDATPIPVDELLPHKDLVRAVAFSPDGRRLATGGDDASVRLWDVHTAKLIGAPLPHEALVGGVAFSPDGKRLATASDDGTVRFWETATKLRIGDLLTHNRPVRALAFSPDGKQLLTGCDDQTAQLWDVATQKRVGPAMKHRGWVRAVAFSPDGKHLATASDTSTRLWTTKPLRDLGAPLQHQGYVHTVVFSPDGKLLLTGSHNVARLWSLATHKQVASFPQQGEMVPSVAFSADGKLVATASGSAARLWDLATTLPIGPPLQHRDWVAAIAFSPDGRRLATASKDASARLWDVPTPVEGGQKRVELWTQTLTTMELNDDASRPLSRRDWEQRQQALEEQGGPASRFHRLMVSSRSLDDRQATRYERSGRWFAADWHLDRLISASPEDASLYARRGLARAHLARWADADSDFAIAADRTNDIESWYDHALLRLHLGDEAGYRSISNLMRHRFPDVADDATARWLSLTWSLAPDAVADRQWHLGLARSLADRNPKDPFSLEALGIAFFRAGAFDKAVEPLSEVVKFPDHYEAIETARAHAGRLTVTDLRTTSLKSVITQECAASSRLFLAMVHGRLGHAEEARRLIREANLRLGPETLLKPDDDDGSELSWTQRLLLARLRREVEESLKETGISVPKSNRSEDNHAPTGSPTRSDE